MPNEKPLTEEERKHLIHSESFTTMLAKAMRIVFGGPVDNATWAMFERIPTLQAIHGCASTETLVEVISADLGVEKRQGYRYLQKAVREGYVRPCTYRSNSSVTDNRLTSDLNIPAKMARLDQYRISIAKAVEAQLADPLNLTAGKSYVEEIYMHPVSDVLEAREKAKSKGGAAFKVRHIGRKARRPNRGGLSGKAAAIVAGILLIGSLIVGTGGSENSKVGMGKSKAFIEMADKVDGWKKVTYNDKENMYGQTASA